MPEFASRFPLSASACACAPPTTRRFARGARREHRLGESRARRGPQVVDPQRVSKLAASRALVLEALTRVFRASSGWSSPTRMPVRAARLMRRAWPRFSITERVIQTPTTGAQLMARFGYQMSANYATGDQTVRTRSARGAGRAAQKVADATPNRLTDPALRYGGITLRRSAKAQGRRTRRRSCRSCSPSSTKRVKWPRSSRPFWPKTQDRQGADIVESNSTDALATS